MEEEVRIMTPNRLSVRKITNRALKKCTKFYRDGVHAWCTPQEYVVLCWYFGSNPNDFDYYMERVKSGDSQSGTHYIHVKRWNDEDVFPVNKYALLDCRMSNPR